MQKITDTIIGAGSIGLIEVVPNLVPAQTADYSAVFQTLIQLAIGVVTLLGLFKKKRVSNL